MLLNMHIKNFALIDEIDIDFSSGFNVLTGETGAGKSIIIDAVNLVLGGRASGDFIRSGQDSAVVSAVFDITGLADLQNYLADIGIGTEEDNVLHIMRELSATGKNNCRINGKVVNLAIYRDVGRNLLDIYGQHEHQSLLRPEKQLDLLDRLGSEEVLSLKEKAKQLYHQIRENKALLEKITGGERDRIRQKDLYQFQLQEIDQSALVANEDLELENEKKILANAEKLAKLSRESYVLLYGGANGAAAIDMLNQAISNIKEIAALDDTMQNLLSVVEEATCQIEEAARDLRSYSEGVEFDPGRLEAIENRLDLIKNLKRKYGATIEEILEYREEIAAELEIIESGDEKVTALRDKISHLESEFRSVAEQLSDKRKKLAAGLEKDISKQLQELLMPQVKFRINFSQPAEPTPQGSDQVEFLISPNPGEPLKPLSKIASGGELSRIMLAVKTILANADEIPTMIFDEIDTGLGGRAAYAVAEKLAFLGQKRQVICVTHSPQVASLGENHLFIKKETTGKRTVTEVHKLDWEGRIMEIARMLGGKEVTELTVQHARELISGKR